MDNDISKEDVDKINESIREKYVQVAKTPDGQFEYPTGKKGLEALQYDGKLIGNLPDDVVASYCGVGNPFSLGKIEKGEKILDVGCGAGVDTILAAEKAGPEGEATGIDIVPEMIEKAESNRKMVDTDNVKFINTSGEKLPFSDDTFDVVISNGVINLIPDKKTAMTEIIRVLKPGGRLMMADQVATGSVRKDIRERISSWFQ